MSANKEGRRLNMSGSRGKLSRGEGSPEMVKLFQGHMSKNQVTEGLNKQLRQTPKLTDALFNLLQT